MLIPAFWIIDLGEAFPPTLYTTRSIYGRNASPLQYALRPTPSRLLDPYRAVDQNGQRQREHQQGDRSVPAEIEMDPHAEYRHWFSWFGYGVAGC